MEILYYLLSGIVGFLVGAIVFGIGLYLIFRSKNEHLRLSAGNESEILRTQLESLNRNHEAELQRASDLQLRYEQQINAINALTADKAALESRIEAERTNSEEKLKTLLEAQEALKDSFSSLSSEALERNRRAFVENAEQVLKNYKEMATTDLDQRQKGIGELVRPVREQLEKVSEFVREVEKTREGAYAELKTQVHQMQESQGVLRDTATQLVKVLGNTKNRGQWGEIQLRRVVEIAGMTNYCDFEEQVHLQSESGKKRPDLVVKLPSDRVIIVDAKAPMDSFLEAHEADNETAKAGLFKKHATAIRSHVNALKSKAYQADLEQSPEFVVLFLPNEAVYSTALEFDPTLIEDGAQSNVIIATPTTLIALLKAVAYGWRQEKIADEVKKFGDLGLEFYNRLATMVGHVNNVGKSLTSSVDNYNKMVGSIDKRLMPIARKFKESNLVGDSAKELNEPDTIESTTKSLAAVTDAKATSESTMNSEELFEKTFDEIGEDFEKQFGKIRIAGADGGRE
ncbi:MAG: DNA recombination protein RmuC [Pyrinomonadaceae bacterium]